jgi:exodeoxyribonuclease V gamma subunit
MFLETILAARDRIRLSYVAREAKTGDAIEPSTLIHELREIIRGYADGDTVGSMTIKHRVSRHDPAYFSDLPGVSEAERNAGLKSYDRDARREARIAMLKRNLAAYCADAALPAGDELLDALPGPIREKVQANLRMAEPPGGQPFTERAREEIELPLFALRRFLECPMQASARYALGMFKDEETGEEAENEPLEQSPLERSILLREVFWATGGNEDSIAKKYDEAQRLAQMHGHAPAGIFADAMACTDREEIRGWIEKVKAAGAADLDRWMDIRIGRADESFRADRIIKPIRLDVRIAGPDGKQFEKRVDLYGTIRGISLGLDTAVQCVSRDKVKPKDFLALFINVLALIAAGEPVAPEFHAIVAGSEKALETRKLPPMSRSEAHAYLASLAADLLSGSHDYFLPIEAAADAVAAMKKPGGDPVAAIEKMRHGYDNEKHYCSSDRGPIRKAVAHDVEPPVREKLESIIERRFGPIITIFAKMGGGPRDE